MKNFYTYASAFVMTSIASGAMIQPMSAQSNQTTYRFPRTEQTNVLHPYSYTLYSSGNHTVNTFAGAELYSSPKDTIKSFALNPTGINFMIVEKGKDAAKSKAGIYSTLENKRKLAGFDSKRYGVPVCATYFPDARQIAISTANNGILLADAKKMIPYVKLSKIDAVPTMMVVSPNTYYLAAVKGDKCYIFNIETRTLRTTIDAGEPITDVVFSPNNDDMAILTNDGVLTIYNTRTFEMRKIVDELGSGTACAYNLDGKYVGVVTGPDEITVVNLLNDADRDVIDVDGIALSDIIFISDTEHNTVMAYAMAGSVNAQRMLKLKPFFNKLVSDEAENMMNEWLKMMPGETMEQYRTRVSDDARARQRAKFEYELATKLASGILSESTVSIGAYDRSNQLLGLELSNMPTIFIKVPEDEVTAFSSPKEVEISDVLFGVMPDDEFEIVYAKVNNLANGKSYIYDNLDRSAMKFLQSDNMISIDVLQQQQMEELKLQELREQVMMEAKQANVISDHTNITIDSKVVPDYDAEGNKILNYEVNISYTVEPGFSAQEDFGPGKYHISESGAATSMAKILKQAFEGDLRQYVNSSKAMRVRISGSADATPILNGLAYDGSFGEFEDEPVYIDGTLSALSLTKSKGIKDNPQLAFARAIGVKDYLENNVEKYNDINKTYNYDVNVSKDKGSEHRRISATFTFVDAFSNK